MPESSAPGDATAGTYDAWFDTEWGRFAFDIERRTLDDAVSVHAASRVLDAGCGTGRFTQHLAARFTSVVGLDLARQMLAIAERRARVPFVEGVAAALPFGDSRFDLAVAITLCEFTDDPAAVITELARVVRPWGLVVVGSLNRRSPWGLVHRRRLHREPWRAARFLTRRQLIELGRRHGYAELHASLFAASATSKTTIANAIERIGRRLAPACGAFQVLVIEKRGR